MNYFGFVAKLVAGVDFLTGKLGSAYSGTFALMSNLLAQGATLGIESKLPGHPNQAEDALNQSGADAKLFRYRGESLASWRSRVSNPWTYHEQAGTTGNLFRIINEWASIVFPDTWTGAQLHITEDQWPYITIWLDAGAFGWSVSPTYGSGTLWGQTGLLYGVSNANPEDIETLRRIVRQWKRGITRARGCIVITGHVWGQPLLTWAGFTYGGSGSITLGF